MGGPKCGFHRVRSSTRPAPYFFLDRWIDPGLGEFFLFDAWFLACRIVIQLAFFDYKL